MGRVFEYRHIVGFEETNLVGNVYYASFISWQGRCREMFLRENVPQILDMFTKGLALITISVSCEFVRELSAFDEVIIRMQLEDLRQNRVVMKFDYARIRGGFEETVARGHQEIACMQREDGNIRAMRMPDALLTALRFYQED
jgi:enediyne biosynthesis thioesterase